MKSPPHDGWVPLKLRDRRRWNDLLETFTFEGWSSPFDSGQFVTLAAELGQDWVKRHYSIASRSGQPLELFLTLVPEGRLTPHLYAMAPGDRIWCWPKPRGHFRLEKVPDGTDLWLVGTGTGLSPFLSMIRDGACFDRFNRVVLIHSVRHSEDLSYRAEIEALVAQWPALSYVAATSREQSESTLYGRVTTALSSGELEARVGLTMDAERSQVMLCGNPAMVNEMKGLLEARSMPVHKRSAPGNVHMEQYW